MQIKRIKKFEENDLKILFSSVEWKSANNPKLLQKAFLNSTNVVSVWDNEKLIGIIRSMDDGYWSANIDCLVVHKDYQKQGVGKLLVSELLHDLKDINYINVCPDEKAMFEFYEQFGFKLINGCYLQKTNI